MATHSFGLLPFIEREVAWITILGIDQAAWHLPAVFKVELARDLPQLVFVEGHRLGRHRLGIDPAPHGMAMPTPFFFMEDDYTRLVR